MGGALKILRVPNIHIGRWALGVCRGWVVGGPWECVRVGGWCFGQIYGYIPVSELSVSPSSNLAC